MPPTEVPSALGMIVARPAMTAAAAELLVPRSIPMILGVNHTLPKVCFRRMVCRDLERVEKHYGISDAPSLFEALILGRLLLADHYEAWSQDLVA